MDSLLCTETISPNDLSGHRTEQDLHLNLVARDSVFTTHRTVLDTLIINQIHYTTNRSYLQSKSEHGSITSNIRSVLAHWMLEVCENKSMEDQVYMVAMNILDRFLSTMSVHRQQLQLTACACLLIASKVRHCEVFPVELLAYFTENSVTAKEIRDWEILIYRKINWDVSPITALDFISPILNSFPEIVNDPDIRKHAVVYTTLTATDSKFLDVLPSKVAATCILMAVDNNIEYQVPDLISRLTASVNLTAQEISSLKETLTLTVNEFTSTLNNGGVPPQQEDPSSSNDSNNNQENNGDDFLGDKMMRDTGYENSGKTTPVDVMDIEFD